MNGLLWLAGFYFTQIKNTLKSPSARDVIRITMLSVFAVSFFWLIYQLFFFIIKNFYSAPVIGGFLVNKILSSIFMAFSIMTILSSIVASISILYLSRDMDFLFSMPMKIEDIFTMQYLKIIFNACWMIFIISIPIFAAYARVVHAGAAKFILIMLCHLPFFVTLASAGIVITMLLVKFFPAQNVRNTAVIMSGLFMVFIIIYFRALQPEKITGANLSDTAIMGFVQNLRTADSIFLPHTWLIKTIMNITSYGVLNSIGYIAGLVTAAVIIFCIVVVMGKFLYFEGYGKKDVYAQEKPLTGYTYDTRGVLYAQLSKDMKYFTRDTSQWIQIIFLTGLIIIYLFNMWKLPADLFSLKNLIYFLNIGFVGFVLSAVGSRLILPVISIEGQAFWIFKAAPFSIRKYVIYKFLLYALPLIIIGQVIAFASVKILKTDEFIKNITIFSTFFITVTVAGAGIGFGAYFAKFNIKNAEEFIAGAPGLIYMFSTSIFIALVLWIESGPVRQFYMYSFMKKTRFFAENYNLNYLLIVLISVIIIAASLEMGIRRLEKLED